MKFTSSLFLKIIPFISLLIISIGPGQASDDKTGVLQIPASTNTNPGSSHRELKIKPLEFLNNG